MRPQRNILIRCKLEQKVSRESCNIQFDLLIQAFRWWQTFQTAIRPSPSISWATGLRPHQGSSGVRSPKSGRCLNTGPAGNLYSHGKPRCMRCIDLAATWQGQATGFSFPGRFAAGCRDRWAMACSLSRPGSRPRSAHRPVQSEPVGHSDTMQI